MRFRIGYFPFRGDFSGAFAPFELVSKQLDSYNLAKFMESIPQIQTNSWNLKCDPNRLYIHISLQFFHFNVCGYSTPLLSMTKFSL